MRGAQEHEYLISFLGQVLCNAQKKKKKNSIEKTQPAAKPRLLLFSKKRN
jgi:hypothetical protein